MISMLDMGMEYSYVKVGIMMDTGKIINLMAMEKRSIMKEIVLRGNGAMMKSMDLLKSYLRMEQYMRETFRIICKMDLVRRRDQMEIHIVVSIEMD